VFGIDRIPKQVKEHLDMADLALGHAPPEGDFVIE
jgi:hypothetical protein